VCHDAVLDALPFAALLVDRDARVLQANPRFCELFGATVPATVGRELGALAGGLFASSAVSELVASGFASGAPASLEIDAPARAGAPARALRLRVRRLRSRAAADAPELLLLLEERAEKAQDAAAIVTARIQTGAAAEAASGDDLVSRASHELRGPFGSIANWVHLLSESSKDAALVQQGLAAIQRAVKSGSQIVDDLHDLAQLRTGRLRLSSGLVDLTSILDTSLDKPRAAALEKGVTLEVQREVPTLPVMGDPIRLQQILLHLVANAVKFTPPGGRVDVVLGREESTWRVTVNDTGRGVPPNVLPRIFDGLRLPGGSSPGSLGVGLSIVRHLAVLHGGSVEASSAGPGLGSRFVLRLPVPALAPSKQSPSPRGVTRQPGPNDSSSRIAGPVGLL
jgi:two-component system, chemotaxis family, CheB/CheR fusion protein